MAYTYDPIFAADPNNPAVVASNAAVLIYDPADTGKAPIAITDSSGSPLANPITVSQNGFGPAFQHPTIDRVAWQGGGFEGFFTSYEGLKNAALDAAEAANVSADSAATAAANASAAATASLASAVADAEAAQAAATAAANLVGAPADSAVQTLINAGGSATRTALNATYATPAAVTAAVAPKLDTATAATTYATVAGMADVARDTDKYWFNHTLLTKSKWKAGLDRVAAGTGNASILVVGDSTSWGFDSGGADGDAPPKLLSDALNRYVAPSQYTFMIPPGSSAPTAAPASDGRWGVGSGWGNTTWGFGGYGCFQHTGTGTSTPLTATPGIECDTFDVYYMKNSGLGSIAISVDGGTVTNVSANGTWGWAKTTITVTAGSSHVLSIVKSANTVFIFGVNAYLSTKKSIHVKNAGLCSSRAYTDGTGLDIGWGSSTHVAHSLAGIEFMAPDLTIIQLGVNDAQLGPNYSSTANWEAATRALIASAKISGDVILASVVPSQIAATTPGTAGREQAYRDRSLIIAQETGAIYLDLFGRFGSWVTANAAAYMADELHLTPLGSQDVANAYRRILGA